MNRSQYPHIADEELVLYALMGNVDAFDELVRRFRGAVVLVAEPIIGSRAGAEDVAQETFLLAFRALPQLRTPAKFAGWLYAIARHRARRVVSRECRQAPTEPSRLDEVLLSVSRELTVCPEATLQRREEHDCVREALMRLPSVYREALLLRYYEEWPLARIASFLSLSLPTTKWRLHQGRLLLRHQLMESKENEHG